MTLGSTTLSCLGGNSQNAPTCRRCDGHRNKTQVNGSHYGNSQTGDLCNIRRNLSTQLQTTTKYKQHRQQIPVQAVLRTCSTGCNTNAFLRTTPCSSSTNLTDHQPNFYERDTPQTCSVYVTFTGDRALTCNAPCDARQWYVPLRCATHCVDKSSDTLHVVKTVTC